MRLPNTAHTSQPWRIHELTPDFRLEDVWALPTPGGPDDFPRWCGRRRPTTPARSTRKGRYVGDGSRGALSRVSRALFALRWKLGDVSGGTTPDAGAGRRVAHAARPAARPTCATRRPGRTRVPGSR
jgi:hypothetical protein